MMAFLAFTASAQIESGFRAGVRINGGLSCLNNKYYWYEAAFGYGAAFIAEYNFKPTVFFQSGVGVENIAYHDIGINNVFYAQIPIQLGYRYMLDSSKACFFQAGPTFSIGLCGPHIHGWDGKISYFDSEDRYGARRFDFGFGGRAGIELCKIQISIGAYYGVTGVFPKNYGGHNLAVNLGVAYMF